MDQVQPAHATVGDAVDDARDVDVAVLKVLRTPPRSPEGMGNENMVPSGKMGLGQPPDPESKPLRLMISFFRLQISMSGFRLCARVTPRYADI